MTIVFKAAVLKCLLVINPQKNSARWLNGPVICAPVEDIYPIMELFCEWVISQSFKIVNASTPELNNFQSLYISNKIISLTNVLPIEISLSAVIKKELTGDIWDETGYRSGGKKRKLKTIINRVIKDGIKVISDPDDYPYDSKEMYLKFYAKLLSDGYEYNNISGQDAFKAAEILMLQDRLGHSKTFFAFNHNVLVCCMNFAIMGNEIYLRKLAINREVKDSGASYYTMMVVAEWAKSHNFKTLNLTTTRLTLHGKDKNLRQYKSRFGGKVYPIYELSTNK
ncbi:hypothetical protein [Xenorhabdus bovienii]|uniref:hypothetical protein n=1 Tax=Xenorhabdus bovienii TaxID=40576 RepID=UPI0023B2B136|nr:hypothetical protein [Xenorhabdus bovienii]MDE9541066.1 hypothetical protein [Xenorhabdus bovienii]